VAYELFERSAVRVETPVISVTPGGRVTFNAAACRILDTCAIRAAVILWDRTTSRMAVRAAPEAERNSFKITFTGGNHSASFAAKSFFKHIGWRAPKRQSLDTTWRVNEKMFEVTLPAEHLQSELTRIVTEAVVKRARR
jgi:hypothetical protein